MLSGLGRSISRALVPPGLDPSPALAAGQRGMLFASLRRYSAVGRPDAPFYKLFRFEFVCASLELACRLLCGFALVGLAREGSWVWGPRIPPICRLRLGGGDVRPFFSAIRDLEAVGTPGPVTPSTTWGPCAPPGED